MVRSFFDLERGRVLVGMAAIWWEYPPLSIRARKMQRLQFVGARLCRGDQPQQLRNGQPVEAGIPPSDSGCCGWSSTQPRSIRIKTLPKILMLQHSLHPLLI